MRAERQLATKVSENVSSMHLGQWHLYIASPGRLCPVTHFTHAQTIAQNPGGEG